MPSEIYLDNSTLAAPSQALLEHVQHCMKEWCGHSPTAPYFKGKKLLTSMEETLEMICSSVGADRGAGDQFIFSHSGAAATLRVYMSAMMNRQLCKGKNDILMVPATGRSAPLLTQECFERLGISLRRAPLDTNGELTKKSLEKLLSSSLYNIGLLSLPWANAYTGVIHPIEQLGEVCQKRGVLLHVDASTILGKLHFHYAHLPIDYLTFEGSLIHGPRGSGGIFARGEETLQPLIFEERVNILHNAPLFMGLGIAFKELHENFDRFATEGARLRDILERGIQEALPQAKILFRQARRLPHVSLMTFPGVSGELLSFHLKEANVLAFFGDGYSQSLEEQLIPLSIDPLDAKSAVSFSLSRNTTEEEVRRAVDVIICCVQKCCNLSEGVMS